MMSVKENQLPKVMKKQCNIDKHEIFPQCKIHKKISMDKNDSTAFILRQTNIFPVPISSNLSPLNKNCAQKLSPQNSPFQLQPRRNIPKSSSSQLPNASGKSCHNGSLYLLQDKAGNPNTLHKSQKEKQRHLVSKQRHTDNTILCQKQSLKLRKKQILSKLQRRKDCNDLHTSENDVQPTKQLKMKDLDNLMKVDISPCKELPTNLLHESPKSDISDHHQISAIEMNMFNDLNLPTHRNLSEGTDVKIRDLIFDTSGISSPGPNNADDKTKFLSSWSLHSFADSSQSVAASSCDHSHNCDAISFSPSLYELPVEKVQLDFGNSDLEVDKEGNFPLCTSIVTGTHQDDENRSKLVDDNAENEIRVRELLDGTDEDFVPIINKKVLSLNDLESPPVPSILTEVTGHLQNSNFSLPQTVGNGSKVIGSVSTVDGNLMTSMLQGQGLDVDSDCDDILQSSLNRFSFNRSHLVSLGTSLRLMRLHRVLQGRGEEKRENIMRLNRYFSTWRKNIRKSVLLHKHESYQWRRAELHYNNHLIMKHFYGWIHSIKFGKMLADSFYHTRMLSKGISAFKWLLHEISVRNKTLEAIKLERIKRCYYNVWKQRLFISRRNRLAFYFKQWRKQYWCIAILQIYKHQRKDQTLIKYYKCWRERLQCRNKEKVIHQFYCYRLKMKCFLLQSSFHEWRRKAYALKMQHGKQVRLSRHFRMEKMRNQMWNTWKRMLAMKKKEQDKLRYVLRSYFIEWKKALRKKIYLKNLVKSYVRKITLQRCMNTWICYVITRRDKRTDALLILQRCLLRCSFRDWLNLIRQKKFQHRKVEEFQIRHKKLVGSAAFAKWRSSHYKHLAVRAAEVQRRRNCAASVGRRWLVAARSRRRERSCSNLVERFSRALLLHSFNQWKIMHVRANTRLQKAEKHYRVVCEQRMLKVFRGWRKQTEESLLLKPILGKRNRKLFSKVFDSWIGIVKTKRNHIDACKKVEKLHTRRFFQLWKQELSLKQRGVVVNENYERKLKSRAMGAWIEYINRLACMRDACARGQAGLAKACLHLWFNRTCERQRAAKQAALQQQEKQDVLSKYFYCWYSMIRDEMIFQEAARMYFDKNRRERMKLECLQQWRLALSHQRKARKFCFSVKTKQLSKSFLEWQKVTQMIMDESSRIFSSSLNSRSQSSETRSFSSSITSFSCDYHGIAHSTTSHELDDHETYHEPTTDSGLGLVKDLLSGCSSPLFPMQIQRPVSTAASLVGMVTTQLDGASEETEVSISASSVNDNTVISADCLHDHTTASVVGRFTRDGDAMEDSILHSLITASECSFYEGDDHDQHHHDLVLDGVVSIHQNGDDDGSLSVSDLTTQREVFPLSFCPDQSVDYQLVLPSAPLFPSHIQAQRPRYLHDALKQNLPQSRFETLVRFMIERLSKPLLSAAFYQWLLFVKTLKWDEINNANIKRYFDNQKLRTYFTLWKSESETKKLALRHHEMGQKSTALRLWSRWAMQQMDLKKRETIMSNRIDQRNLQTCFSTWISLHRKRNLLNDILAYWKNQLKIKCQKESIEQRHCDVMLLRHAYVTWLLKWKQLRQCDDFHMKTICRRLLRNWNAYTDYKLSEKSSLLSIHRSLVKTRCFIMWRRALKRSEKVEELRTRAVKSFVVDLLTRWKQRARNSRIISAALECYTRKSNHELALKTLQLWKINLEKTREARKFKSRLLLRSCVTSWYVMTRQREEKDEKICLMKRKRNQKLIINSFSVWTRAHFLNIRLKYFEIRRKRLMWKSWCHHVQLVRAQKLGDVLLLRRSWKIWRREFDSKLKKKEVAKGVFIKWRVMVDRNRVLNQTCEEFVASKSNIALRHSFMSWSIANCQLCLAKTFHQKNAKSSALLAWKDEARMKRLEKSRVNRFKLHCDAVKTKSLWFQWKNELRRCALHQVMLDTFKEVSAPRRQLTTWLRWKKRSAERKAEKFCYSKVLENVFHSWMKYFRSRRTNKQNYNLFVKTRTERILVTYFTSWTSSLRHKRTADSHFLLSISLKMFQRWQSWSVKKGIMKEKVRCFAKLKQFSLIKTCSAIWQERFHGIQEMKFIADEMYCSNQMSLTRFYFTTWTRKKDAVRLRSIFLQRKFVGQWMQVTRDKIHNRASVVFYKTKIKKKFFQKWWHSHQVKIFRKRQDRDVIVTSFSRWHSKLAAVAFAIHYSDDKMVKRTWSMWKMKFYLSRCNAVISGDVDRDVLLRTFAAWKSLVPKRTSLKSPRVQSRIPRIKR